MFADFKVLYFLFLASACLALESHFGANWLPSALAFGVLASAFKAFAFVAWLGVFVGVGRIFFAGV